MAVIPKKIWPEYFDLIVSEKKKFEVRLADFNIKKGDVLFLREWNPKTKKYTGRSIKKKATFVFQFFLSAFGQEKEIKEKGLQIISLE